MVKVPNLQRFRVRAEGGRLMLGFAPRTSVEPTTPALGTVLGPSGRTPWTRRGPFRRTVRVIVLTTMWAVPPVTRAVWSVRWELAVMGAMLAAQGAAIRAAHGTVRVPWVIPAEVGEDGLFGAGIGIRPVHLGPWVWWLLGLGVVVSLLAATGALSAPKSRHWVTVALVLSVALTAVLSEPTGLHPWSLIVGPVAAILWALLSPAGPDSRVRNRIRQARLVRIWRRRVLHASDGHLWVVPPVTEGDYLTLVECRLRDAAQDKVDLRLGDLATGLGLARGQLSVASHPSSAQVTLTVRRGDPLADPVTSTVTSLTAGPEVPVRVGRDERGNPATVALLGGHHLVAGITGAGKSKAFLLLLIGAVQRGAELHVVDLKWGIEAGPIAPRCTSVAKTRGAAAVLIAGVRDEMERRGQRMAAEGWSDWGQSPDPKPLVLGVDEVAQIKEDPETWGNLLEIVRLGRAPWVVAVLATQRATGDTIPSKVTGQLGSRWLGRMTPAESEVTMLGATSPTAPYELPDVKKFPGRAVLVQGGQGVEIQTDLLSDEAVRSWAAAAPLVVADPAGVPVLPAVQATVLAVVQASPGRTAEWVAGELGKDRSQITRTLRALAGKGLVEATDTKPATWQATNKEQAA